MRTSRLLAVSVASSVLLAAPALTAQDLSGYRSFKLGATLAAVAQQAGIDPQPKILQQRPALIEELMWQPLARRSPLSQGDSVKKLLFTFYNGQLFRMVVSYEPDRTAGMTSEDLIASVSEMYGLSLLRATPIGAEPLVSDVNHNPAWPATPLGFAGTPLALWADADHSIHLFRSPYQPTFGLVISLTRLDVLARAAAVEGARLDIEEAPQREVDRLRQKADDKRFSDAKARDANKVTFRP
jgi:hypothetical protein